MLPLQLPHSFWKRTHGASRFDFKSEIEIRLEFLFDFSESLGFEAQRNEVEMFRPAKIAVLAAVLGAPVFFFAARPVAVEGQTAIRGFAPERVSEERELEQKMRRIPDAEHAEKDLRRLTSEPHMAGTEGSHRVAMWLRDQYRNYGFDADIVSYVVWLPLPTEVKIDLVEPEKKVLATQEEPFEWDKDSYDKRAVARPPRPARAR